MKLKVAHVFKKETFVEVTLKNTPAIYIYVCIDLWNSCKVSLFKESVEAIAKNCNNL